MTATPTAAAGASQQQVAQQNISLKQQMSKILSQQQQPGKQGEPSSAMLNFYNQQPQQRQWRCK